MKKPNTPNHNIPVPLHVRQENLGDLAIIDEVINRDCYQLAKLKGAGFDPKIIIDIGAHIGTFAALAHLLWPQARIFCVEPDEGSFELLTLNAPFAKRIKQAAYYGDEALTLIDDEVSSGNGFVMTQAGLAELDATGRNYRLSSSKGYVVQDVQSTTIERIASEFYLDQIDLVKINCGEAEENILTHASPSALSLFKCVVGKSYRSVDLDRFSELAENALPHLSLTLENPSREGEKGRTFRSSPRRAVVEAAPHIGLDTFVRYCDLFHDGSSRNAMRYVHGIVAVNRSDLLHLAVESVRCLWPHAFILDNSRDGYIGRNFSWPIPVVRPSVPLSCAQSMNFLQRIAMEQGADVFGYQHNDAEANSGSAEKYFQIVRSVFSSHRNWATIFTHYDILSGYNVRAVEKIGEWDAHFPLPNYHIDVDWFHRARLLGFELVDTDVGVTHHEGSSTVRSDPHLSRIGGVTARMNCEYYETKWGGGPHCERFRTPWNI